MILGGFFMNNLHKIMLLMLLSVGFINCVTFDQLLKSNPEREDQQQKYADAFKAWEKTPEYQAAEKAANKIENAFEIFWSDLTLQEIKSGPRNINDFRRECSSQGTQSSACQRYEELKTIVAKRVEDAKEKYHKAEQAKNQLPETHAFNRTCDEVEQELRAWESFKNGKQNDARRKFQSTPAYAELEKAKENLEKMSWKTYVLPGRTLTERYNGTTTLNDFRNLCDRRHYHTKPSDACVRFDEMIKKFNDLSKNADDNVQEKQKIAYNTPEYKEHARLQSIDFLKQMAAEYVANKEKPKA